MRALDFSDDRLAWVLDQLQVTERWSAFETLLNPHLIRLYQLHPQRVRLDPSTLSTYAPVSENGLLQLGPNKDGRPGDAQLKFQLGVLDPLGLPLVTQVVAGNSADAPLYAPAIRQVQASLGAGGLTYIGDSKMAARAPRALLVASGDYYLAPLGEAQAPKRERAALIQAALDGTVTLQAVERERPAPLAQQTPLRETLAEGYEVSVPLTALHDGRELHWNERRLVVRSHAYARAETAALAARLTRAETELRELAVRKQGKRPLDQVQRQAAAAASLTRQRVADLLTVTVESHTSQRQVRAYKERPAQLRSTTSLKVRVVGDESDITAAQAQLGWRIYGSNQPDLTLPEAVLAYREQYRLEDGISRVKGRPLGLAPRYLQTETRMVGLLHLLTIALRVLTLVEFQVRRALQTADQPLRGVYAGQPGRQTRRPSTELLLAAVQGLDAAHGTLQGVGFTYLRPLTATQTRILRLLGLDEQLYARLLPHFQNLAPE